MTHRWDETWHRLREWTNGQGPSERLAAQILLDDGYEGLDPSHPLGGKDGAKDAICHKNGQRWIMAVHFPRGQCEFAAIKDKFEADLAGVAKNSAVGIVFVTNQELRLAERVELRAEAAPVHLDLFHLERITTILDKPMMAGVRKQFLQIDYTHDAVRDGIESVKNEMLREQKRLEGLQTGGDSYCYWMLYHFDMTKNVARNFVVIRKGEFPLYDLRFQILNMDTLKEWKHNWGELNSPAGYRILEWPLPESAYYRVVFHARNGSWHQDLQLRRSEIGECWLAATRVVGSRGDIRFSHVDDDFPAQFGEPEWRA